MKFSLLPNAAPLPMKSVWMVGLLLFCSYPGTGHAQYVCPNGPGPGERQVGVTGGGPIAPIPLCMSDGGGYDDGGYDDYGYDGPPPPTDFYEATKGGQMAAAYHMDTSSVWITISHKNMETAKKAALDGCNAATGGGCTIAATLSGFGKMYVAEDGMGLLWIKGVPRDSKNIPTTDHAVMAYCNAHSFGCKNLGDIENSAIAETSDGSNIRTKEHFPTGALTWNHWAMVAQPAQPQGKSWLISGKQRSAAARQELLNRCKADTGVECTIKSYAANGVLVHYRGNGGQTGWLNAGDEDSVEERLARGCPAAQRPCERIATYDAATPRMEVITDTQ